MKWEDRVEYCRGCGLILQSTELDFLGKQGWELINIIVDQNKERSQHYFFKRPVLSPLPKGIEREGGKLVVKANLAANPSVPSHPAQGTGTQLPS